MSTRQLCTFFYTDLGDGLFSSKKCNCCRKQAAGSGYSNLISHLASKHAGYVDEYATFRLATTATIDAFGFVDETTNNIFEWVDWLAMRNMPISEMENDHTRKVVKMKPTSAKTIKAYMRFAAAKVSAVLLPRWESPSDSCSTVGPTTRSICSAYSQSISRTASAVSAFLLYHRWTRVKLADAHIEHIACVLSVYEKTWSMVRFIVADNCSTNQCIATRVNLPLIGCASHRFNVAANLLLNEHRDQIDQIQNMMIQLRHVNNAAELAKATDLKPIKANVTRWPFKYKMLDRYIAIRDAIMTVSAVEELIPRGNAHRRICVLVEKLSELDSVCVKLQAEKRSLAEARLLFDACVEKYPVMTEYLAPDAATIHSPAFESGAIKISNDLPLSGPEQRRARLRRRGRACAGGREQGRRLCDECAPPSKEASTLGTRERPLRPTASCDPTHE